MAFFFHPRSLKLRNFKGISELELKFDETLTLLAGVNGVGKSSVMEALLAAVCRVWHQFPPHETPPFPLLERVVRTGAECAELVLGLGDQNGDIIEFHLELREGSPKFVKPLWAGFTDNIQPLLPLVVYYEQNRGVGGGEYQGTTVSVSSGEVRKSSLRTTISSPSEFRTWFFEKEADEGQEIRERKDLGHMDPELKIVRQVLKQLDGFTRVRSRKPSDSRVRTLFLEKEGIDIAFDSLSGGERAFFLLAADLARRLMLACPGKPIAEVPGIVCIDEIELHLHPAWQRRILKTLMETFSACQFIVTTHSPQVIGGVEARHVRLLTPAGNGLRKVSQPIASKGRDSNYVLRGILGSTERDADVNELFDKFDDLVDSGKLEEAEHVLKELAEAVEGESSRVALRRAKWNRLLQAEI